MSHTKGNWRIIGKSEMDGIEIGIDNKDGTKCPIANVKWYGEDDCNAEEDEANAHLIAAAPDLLIVCQQFINDGRAHSSVIEQGITAITKAVGK